MVIMPGLELCGDVIVPAEIVVTYLAQRFVEKEPAEA